MYGRLVEKNRQREKLASDVDRFMKAGGEIEVAPALTPSQHWEVVRKRMLKETTKFKEWNK